MTKLLKFALVWLFAGFLITLGLYLVGGRCLAAKISAGVWLVPLAVGVIGYYVLLVIDWILDLWP